VIGFEGWMGTLAPLGTPLRLERLLFQQSCVQRGDVLDKLRFAHGIARAVRIAHRQQLVLAVPVIDEGLAQNALHRQKRILSRLADRVLERGEIAGHRQPRAREQLECAFGVAATRRGERGTVVQFGARRVVTQDVEADIARANEIAAGDRRVDVVDGALERGAAPGGSQAREPADALIVENFDLLAARTGTQQPGPFPLVEPATNRFPAHAEIGGDVFLRDLAWEAHAVRFGDADIGRKLDQPVGEKQIGKSMRLVVLLLERGQKPLRADPDQAGAK